MKRKIIIILAILAVCILIASPVFAKEKVKVKITDGDFVLNNKGYIVIKLVDKDGREIRSDGKINYTITDKNGNYKWICKSYKSGIREKYPVGMYTVKVKFFGDSKYKKAVKTISETTTGTRKSMTMWMIRKMRPGTSNQYPIYLRIK